MKKLTILFILLSTLGFSQLKISQLPAASALSGAELLPGAQSGVTVKIPISSLPFIPTSSVSAFVPYIGANSFTTSNNITAGKLITPSLTANSNLSVFTNTGNVDIYAGNTSSVYTQCFVSPTQIYNLASSDGGSTASFLALYGTGVSVPNNGTNNAFVIDESVSSKGAVYAQDYSANFTNESLISKRYGDAKYTTTVTGGYLPVNTATATYVPYTGATTSVNLGANNFSTSALISTNSFSASSSATCNTSFNVYDPTEPVIRGYRTLSDWVQLGKSSGEAYVYSNDANSGFSIFTNNTRRQIITKDGYFTFTNGAVTSGTNIGFNFIGDARTNQTASTENPRFQISCLAYGFANGNFALQREVLITQPTYSFVSASTVTNAATLGLMGAPIAGANTTLSTSSAILVNQNSVVSGGTVTTSYGLNVNAQAGATNNFIARFGSGTAGAITPVGGTNVYQEGSTTNYYTFGQPDAQLGGFTWGAPSDGFGAFLRWSYSGQKLQIGTASSGHSIEFLTDNATASATLSSSALTLSGRINSSTTQTAVAASTSGSITASQPFSGTSYKKVIIYCNAVLGTASYTYPVAFTNTPQILTTNGPAAGVVTALSTTAVTITGATTTGFVILEGY